MCRIYTNKSSVVSDVKMWKLGWWGSLDLVGSNHICCCLFINIAPVIGRKWLIGGSQLDQRQTRDPNLILVTCQVWQLDQRWVINISLPLLSFHPKLASTIVTSKYKPTNYWSSFYFSVPSNFLNTRNLIQSKKIVLLNDFSDYILQKNKPL